MWPGVEGDWGPELWSGGYEAPNSGTSNRLSVTAADGGGASEWGGFFRELIGTGVSYVIAKDAAENGLVQGRAPTGKPVYVQAGTAPVPINSQAGMGGLLLVGGLVVLAVVLTRG